MGWDHRIEDPSLAYVNGLRSPEIDGNLDDDPSQLDRVCAWQRTTMVGTLVQEKLVQHPL